MSDAAPVGATAPQADLAEAVEAIFDDLVEKIGWLGLDDEGDALRLVDEARDDCLESVAK